MAATMGERLRGGVGRVVRGAGRRVARVEAGMLRLGAAQVKLVQQQLLAGLAVQRITVEVVTEGLLKVHERLIQRLDRAAQGEA